MYPSGNGRLEDFSIVTKEPDGVLHGLLRRSSTNEDVILDFVVALPRFVGQKRSDLGNHPRAEIWRGATLSMMDDRDFTCSKGAMREDKAAQGFTSMVSGRLVKSVCLGTS